MRSPRRMRAARAGRPVALSKCNFEARAGSPGTPRGGPFRSKESGLFPRPPTTAEMRSPSLGGVPAGLHRRRLAAGARGLGAHSRGPRMRFGEQPRNAAGKCRAGESALWITCEEAWVGDRARADRRRAELRSRSWKDRCAARARRWRVFLPLFHPGLCRFGIASGAARSGANGAARGAQHLGAAFMRRPGAVDNLRIRAQVASPRGVSRTGKGLSGPTSGGRPSTARRTARTRPGPGR
jgi:hypothetical protein